MKFVILTVACLALLGCAPKSPEEVRNERLSGTWKGLNKEDPKNPKGGASSNILTESLGGYRLDLNRDGTFNSDWRGLKRSGTWKVTGNTLDLVTEKVFDKTRSAAEDENKTGGKAVNDLSLYDSQNKLEMSSDERTLTLKATETDAETVIFTRDSQ